MTSRSVWRTGLRAAAVGTGWAAAGLVYSAGVEVRSFRLRRVEVPILSSGSWPVRVLHISDVHLVPSQHRKRDWIRALAGLEPDLVINTGDNIAHKGAVEPFLQSLGPLLDKPGAFVFGSNDYHSPEPKNPARYLYAEDRLRPEPPPDLPWKDLRDALVGSGWVDLTNDRGVIDIVGQRLRLVGVDDPHLGHDRFPAPSGGGGAADHGHRHGHGRRDGELHDGVTHAPYLRVLDDMVDDGCEMLFAGHTHGGQLCVPGYGALVTNCDLDRGRVKGLSRHPLGSSSGAWLHVSAGLGTSPYAPVRFACPPEATLLTLVER